MDESLNRPHRAIRSFVLRQGRMSDAQQRAYENLMGTYGIPYAVQPLNLNEAFHRDVSNGNVPKILEIGTGMGETTARIAAANPDKDYLGVEVHTPGVGGLLKQAEALGLTNLRVIQHDAVEVLRDMIEDGALDGVHIFFADPWPKKRHHKRRLIQPDFVALLARKLKPGAYLHLATDWQEYAEWMLEVLRGEALLANTVQDYAPRPGYRPETKFERRGLNLGHGVWDLVFKRL
jgi:tRNA (guanine-N7-)-methyltransferase